MPAITGFILRFNAKSWWMHSTLLEGCFYTLLSGADEIRSCVCCPKRVGRLAERSGFESFSNPEKQVVQDGRVGLHSHFVAK